jgi:hypothetical protein
MTHDAELSGRSDQDPANSERRPMDTLVIRTWNEPNQKSGFRARITYIQHPGDQPTTVSTADPEEVVSVVRQWLLTQSGPPHEVQTRRQP